MSNKNLSTVATDVIHAYGITATNVINSTRFGGERMLGYVDQRATKIVKRGASPFNKGIRSDISEGRERVSNVGVKALHLSTSGAQIMVGVAVDLVTKGVHLVATNAERLDRAANLNALSLLNRVAMPAAIVVSQVADRIEAGSSKLVKRVSGTDMPAKAVATRKLDTTTRKAAATRKRVTQQAEQKLVKTPVKRVSKVVAKTATQTSNVARRVARKAKATAASV
ncbi:MAG: hypothetical protein ABIN96_04520 [Rubrivivax sp.]